jgi:hypothetical protein
MSEGWRLKFERELSINENSPRESSLPRKKVSYKDKDYLRDRMKLTIPPMETIILKGLQTRPTRCSKERS